MCTSQSWRPEWGREKSQPRQASSRLASTSLVEVEVEVEVKLGVKMAMEVQDTCSR